MKKLLVEQPLTIKASAGVMAGKAKNASHEY